MANVVGQTGNDCLEVPSHTSNGVTGSRWSLVGEPVTFRSEMRCTIKPRATQDPPPPHYITSVPLLILLDDAALARCGRPWKELSRTKKICQNKTCLARWQVDLHLTCSAHAPRRCANNQLADATYMINDFDWFVLNTLRSSFGGSFRQVNFMLVLVKSETDSKQLGFVQHVCFCSSWPPGSSRMQRTHRRLKRPLREEAMIVIHESPCQSLSSICAMTFTEVADRRPDQKTFFKERKTVRQHSSSRCATHHRSATKWYCSSL